MKIPYSLRAGADVLAATPLFLSAPLFRKWHMRWGATDAEVAAVMPGDDLEPKATVRATRAITIAAPPEAVWPWIVQIGFGRAGFYSYDLLDSLGRPSAEVIIPELQSIDVGDWIPMGGTANETTAFRIEAYEPNAWMLWRKPGSTWAWRLERLGGGRTRLVTRLRWCYEWKSPGLALLTVFLMEFGDYPMMRKLLLGAKRRAERQLSVRPHSG